MKSIELNLDLVQEVFINLAKHQGIPIEELTEYDETIEGYRWNIRYGYSLQEDVDKDIKNMLRCFEHHRMAMDKDDLVEAKGALVEAATFAQMLEETFRKIYEECYKVFDDKRFIWPPLSE